MKSEYEEKWEGRMWGVFADSDDFGGPIAIFKTEDDAADYIKKEELCACFILRIDVSGLIWNSIDSDPKPEFVSPLGEAGETAERLERLINTPEISDFLKAVQIEAAHQRERWGEGHDEEKTPGDWALLLDKIKGKQCQAVWDCNLEKYLHHLITMAAICFNCHRCTVAKIEKAKNARALKCQ